MALRSEPVSKCLEKRLLILGFEVPDILAIFLMLSVLNFTFGQTSFKLALVWFPTLAVAAVLRLGKRGKPDNYLIHLAKFHTRPRYFSAFRESEFPPPPHRRNKTK